MEKNCNIGIIKPNNLRADPAIRSTNFKEAWIFDGKWLEFISQSQMKCDYNLEFDYA